MTTSERFFRLNAQVEAEKILWVQGPGGNTSVKADGKLYVKASGTRIRDLSTMEQLAVLDLEGLCQSMQDSKRPLNSEEAYKGAIEANTLSGSPRPSMESGFHAWLPNKFVFHFHSVVGICLAEIAKGPKALVFNQWFSDSYQHILGPLQITESCLPGLELTKGIVALPPASIYLLRNHGVILAFDEPHFLEVYRDFEDQCLKKFMYEQTNLVESWKNLDVLGIINNQPHLLEGELKFYFPDMAIMYPRIRNNLKPLNAERFRFEVDLANLDRDALENWVVSAMLQLLYPQLPVLPESLCAAIPNLPTEIERKKMMESKS